MRAGLIARIRDARQRSGEESGAVVVIVVLSLIAIFAMLVLTVDVGGLLLARRAMVNASDSAALAAAQSCASAEDTLDPESVADTYAADNVDGVITGTSNITEIVGCDDGNGHVSVEYLTAAEPVLRGRAGVRQHRRREHGGHGRLGPRRRRVRGADRARVGLPAGHLQDPRRRLDR